MDELPLIDEELRRGAMSYSQARAITRVATAEKEEIWIAYAKRMPASQLDTLCRSYPNVQAYDQAQGAEAGAMAAAQVAAQGTVTRRTLNNGMVKFEVVLPSDEAAIVWTALNAAIDTSSAQPTPAGPTLVAEPTPAEQTPEEPSPAEPSPAEPSPAEPTPAEPPNTKAPTSADRGRQRADAFMNIIQVRMRGNRPPRNPGEIIIAACRSARFGGSGGSSQDGRRRNYRDNNRTTLLLQRWGRGCPR
ncbi:MAG: hypothetical protein KBG15_03250 [Kofleriaceae bacterium]|nr:hypothetical protein [Kofleriaceae bacterium]